MRIFATVSVVAMLLFATVVGGRLVLAARRTRQLPELFFGVGFLGIGVGLGVGQLGASFLWTEATLVATLMNAAFFGLVVAGVLALHAAVWRIFHSRDMWGFACFAIGSCLALVAYGMRLGAGDFSAGVTTSRGMQVFCFALIWVLAWSGSEAIPLYLRLRRQARLGLANPLTVSQIGLWGVTASLGAVMVVVISYNLLSLHRSPLDDNFSTGILLLTVFGTSGSMWCAFFPPAALRSRYEPSADLSS